MNFDFHSQNIPTQPKELIRSKANLDKFKFFKYNHYIF